MTAEISIIIPTLNAEATLPRCLESLLEGLPAGLIRELIVSDGGSSDATLAIADAAGAVLVDGAPSRGGQLRQGVRGAKGKWIMVLHADTVLSPGWSQVVRDHISDETSPAYFRLAFRAKGGMPTLVAGWGNLRASVFALPYGDQGLLLRRADYDAAGGYPDQPLMEDVALARALGRPLIALNATASTCAKRYQTEGWLKRGAKNLFTLARFFLGADPKRLAKDYDDRSRPRQSVSS